MGDPAHFSIKGGANPHTRSRWGARKRVDRAAAVRQWNYLRSFLGERGVRVWVVPPDAAWPGLVYPANAGFLLHRDDGSRRLGEKTFYLSKMIESRFGETAIFRAFLEDRGFRCESTALRFEGEADLISTSLGGIFTSGRLEQQRFVPCLAIPPWRRVYGFRSDPDMRGVIGRGWGMRDLLPITLVNEAHYHGDTVLCPFGARKEFLLVYQGAIDEISYDRLARRYGSSIVLIPEADARLYAANSFSFTVDSAPAIVMPAGVSQYLLHEIRERGIIVETVDVSEFLKKGGGSVKCMIGDLGRWREEE